MKKDENTLKILGLVSDMVKNYDTEEVVTILEGIKKDSNLNFQYALKMYDSEMFDFISQQCFKSYGVEVEEMFRRKVLTSTIDPRNLTVILAREHTNLSDIEIAQKINKHPTLITYIRNGKCDWDERVPNHKALIKKHQDISSLVIEHKKTLKEKYKV